MKNYLSLSIQNMQTAVEIYNAATRRGEQNYLLLSEEEFGQLFLTPINEGDSIFAYYSENQEGFIIGHFSGNLKRFFVTMIQVEPGSRRKGIGTALLETLRQEMKQFSNQHAIEMDALEISYFNPVNITWELPDTDGHRHPNSPGVRLGSPAHLFFKNMGFRDFSMQNSYHLELSAYEWPEEKLQPYTDKMSKAGYTVEFYDANKHSGMQDLVDDLNNDLWNYQIPAEMNREGGPRPMLIVNDHGHVGGFAGPLVPDEHGRGFFLGIAIHSRCRGCGAATVLWNRLCLEFQRAGAKYMTIFTAEDNHARSIYETAGFKIHASWATMRRKEKKA